MVRPPAYAGDMADPGPTDEQLDLLHAMFDLAREGRTGQLAAYLDAGVPVDLSNSNGDTLLVLAAYHSRVDTVRALLDRGADHARVNHRGQSALVAAVFRQDEEIVRALLRAGADPDAGRPSARETAAFFELPEMAALLDAQRPGR